MNRLRIFFLLLLSVAQFFAFGQQMAAPVKTSRGWGYLKQDNTFLVAPDYQKFWYDGMFVQDDDGHARVLCEFHDGMAACRRSGKWGFLDAEGKMAIEPRFEQQRDFREQVAAVQYRGKWGYVRKNGSWMIEPRFKEARSFYSGRAAIYDDGHWSFIDTTGQVVLAGPFSMTRNFSPGLTAVEIKGKWGFINDAGIPVIEPQFEDAWNFTDGVARVRKNGLWGYVDSTGNNIIGFRYNKAMPSRNGICRVKLDGFWFFINHRDEILGNRKYENAEDFVNGYARVRPFTWGLIDTTGAYRIKPQFQFVGDYCDGFLRVKTSRFSEGFSESGDWIYIDLDGNQQFKQVPFEKLEDFCNGLARARIRGKWGFIDRKGEFVIPASYVNCLDFKPLFD